MSAKTDSKGYGAVPNKMTQIALRMTCASGVQVYGGACDNWLSEIRLEAGLLHGPAHDSLEELRRMTGVWFGISHRRVGEHDAGLRLGASLAKLSIEVDVLGISVVIARLP